MKILVRAAGLFLAAAVWAITSSGCSDSSGDLSSGDSARRLRAIHELADRGSEASVARLAEAARHQDALTAAEAITAMGRMRNPAATRALAETVATETRPQLRQAAVIAMTQRADPASVPVLRQLVQADPDTDVRGAAAAAIARIGTLDDVDLLVARAMTETDPYLVARGVASVEHLLGVRFRYDPGASPEARRAALQRMQDHYASIAKVRRVRLENLKREARP